MKKNILLLTVGFVLSISTQGQNSRQITPAHLLQSKLTSNQITDNTEPTNLHVSTKNYAPTTSEFRVFQNGMTEEAIGETYYDLQTNNSIQNRLYVHNDNTISAVWTMSPNQSSGFPKRGTGYNYYDGSSWLPTPDSRVETNRTGWPSIAGLNDGEIIASHAVGNDQATIDKQTTLSSRTNKGEGNWSENLLPNSDEGAVYDNVWPRMKVGGPDGQSIHIISNTYDLNNQYVSYSRSLDSGVNWDIIDYILPEIGPDFYTKFGADYYAMDVKGETIAFVIGDAWADVVLMKSTDNGSSWTKTIIKEHPIPFYDNSTLVEDIIENADGSFSISLDNDNNAHIFYGLMGYANIDTTDSIGYSYYPSYDGLVYWNEIEKEETIIASVIDQNGNDTLDIDEVGHIANYRSKSLTSFPSSVIADNGDIYITYSSIIETLDPLQIEIGDDGTENYLQHYRHQYIMRSQDGGENWSDPIDLMAESTDPLTGDPLQEGVFGCISNTVDDYVYLTYQKDHLPGVSLLSNHPITNNQIVFVKIPVAEFNNLSSEEIIKIDEDFYVYPNPSDNMINIKLDNNQEEATINIVNILGETILSTKMTNSETQLSIEALTSGVYFISVETPTNRMVKSLVKK